MPTWARDVAPAAAVEVFPRIVSALDLLHDDSDSDSSIFCAHDRSDTVDADLQASIIDWSLDGPGEVRSGKLAMTRYSEKVTDSAGLDSLPSHSSQRSQLVLQQGNDCAPCIMKFVCAIHICIEDLTEDFCLVKRILGKGGHNMKRLATEHNARIRLRGIGSGFLEGDEMKEADMPLRLDVSCTNYEEYHVVVEKLVALLQPLHKHYARYLRAKGVPQQVIGNVRVEELRRDDLGWDKLGHDRTPSCKEKLSKKLSHRGPPSTSRRAACAEPPQSSAALQFAPRQRTRKEILSCVTLPVSAKASGRARMSKPGSFAGARDSASTRATIERNRRASEALSNEIVQQRHYEDPPTTPRRAIGQEIVSKQRSSRGDVSDTSGTSSTPRKLMGAVADSRPKDASKLSTLPREIPPRWEVPMLSPWDSLPPGVVPLLPGIRVPQRLSLETSSAIGHVSDADASAAESALASEVILALQGVSKSLTELAAHNDLGSRYNALVSGGDGIQEEQLQQSWAQWLQSIPGVSIEGNFEEELGCRSAFMVAFDRHGASVDSASVSSVPTRTLNTVM
eukprot:TRINITY_DN67015_c0_g1_i1.p1 TRINITY_DN67015_c0_g1~~TRINITY_DN67015_c0_g1_i1.p1  ORF type:complete len:617 (+),score=97.85 TRINITY_DN67015_c0_g1_i1:157-1851(+)